MRYAKKDPKNTPETFDIINIEKTGISNKKGIETSPKIASNDEVLEDFGETNNEEKEVEKEVDENN